jgi:Sigma-70, region 4
MCSRSRRRTAQNWCAAPWPACHRKQGEVIDLVYYHGKSVKEVAQIVCIPEARVKTRTMHARNWQP